MRHILVCNPDDLVRFQLCFTRRSTYDLEKVTNHDASVSSSLNGDCILNLLSPFDSKILLFNVGDSKKCTD